MKLRNASKGFRALTLIELLVVLAVIAILFLLVDTGPLSRDKDKAMQAACQNNLKQVGIAFRTWEGDYSNRYPMSVSIDNGGSMEWLAGTNMFWHFRVMSNELNVPRVLTCPADERDPAQGFATLSNNNISYFVGLDSDETLPALWLAGDRNLVTNGVSVIPGLVVITTNETVGWSSKMHKGKGNMLSADGSVMLQRNITNPGTNVNRLAVP
jgi:prepilin-type N-terminal cleavage/methylation domain-containing protein